MDRYRCVMLRRSGATDIRVVRAEDEAAARAILTAQGLAPVSVEAIGPSLFDALRGRLTTREWTLPRWAPPPRGALVGSALILATIPVSIAIGSWALAGITQLRITRLHSSAAPALSTYARAAAIEDARSTVEAVMAGPSLSALADRLAAGLPDDAGLVSLTMLPEGQLIVEIETPDPDRLRSALDADPLFGSLGETGQKRTDGGTIAVSLKGRVR